MHAFKFETIVLEDGIEKIPEIKDLSIKRSRFLLLKKKTTGQNPTDLK